MENESHPTPKKTDGLVFKWDQEQLLEMLFNGQETAVDNWIEKGLPIIVDKIMDKHAEHGSMSHLHGKDLPSKQIVIKALEDLYTIIFPGYLGKNEITKSNVKYYIGNTLNSIHAQLVQEVDKSLKYVCRKIEKCPEDICHKRAQVVVKELLEKIPEIIDRMNEDIQAAYDGDPAAKNTDEVILSYPCVLAISTYRIAHELYIRGIPLIPRIMSEYAHSQTGIDIHPGATIGKSFFIDHGTGVVIGETAKIGDYVKIYQGVTLGALSFPKDERGRIVKGIKRHPTVGNHVVIYSGATILGGETMIGDNSIIGGNAWITSSIPSGTKVIIEPPDLDYKRSTITRAR